MIISGWVLKAAASGWLALMPAIKSLMVEVMAGPLLKQEREGTLAAEMDLVIAAKKLTLFAAGAAVQRFAAKLSEEQEVMAALADMIIAVFTMESALLRAQKMGTGREGEVSAGLAQLYITQTMGNVELAARKVLGAAAEGDSLRTQMAILRRLAKRDPIDVIGLARRVAGAMMRANAYSAG